MLCLVPPIFLVPLASFAAELLRLSPIIFDYFLDEDPLAKILLLFTPNPVVFIPDPFISEAYIFAIADWFLGWSGCPEELATGDLLGFLFIFIADPPDGILIGDTELLLLGIPIAYICWLR